MASQEERDRIMAEYMASVAEEEDDDDDDDEAEFQPGIDDPSGDEVDGTDDDDEEEAGDDSNAILWKGKLSYADSKLFYSGKTTEGDSFELVSAQPLTFWSWKHPTVAVEDAHPPRMRTLGFENSSDGTKVDITLTSTKKRKPVGDDEDKKHGALKSDDEDEDDDEDDGGGKKRAAPPPPPRLQEVNVITVFGRGKGFELYGEFSSSGSSRGSVLLECRYQKVAESAGAASAAAPAADDDDDENIDVDEGVDYNELIALHQDAGMSVTELKKRYRSGEDNLEAAVAAGAKKPKPSEDDDDDDDDIGF